MFEKLRDRLSQLLPGRSQVPSAYDVRSHIPMLREYPKAIDGRPLTAVPRNDAAWQEFATIVTTICEHQFKRAITRHGLTEQAAKTFLEGIQHTDDGFKISLEGTTYVVTRSRGVFDESHQYRGYQLSNGHQIPLTAIKAQILYDTAFKLADNAPLPSDQHAREETLASLVGIYARGRDHWLASDQRRRSRSLSEKLADLVCPR